MTCDNNCPREASVLLTQNMVRPRWFCPYCASQVLWTLNKDSFKSLRERPILFAPPPTKK